MQTEVIRISHHTPEAEKLAKAAAYIHRGELLAFPTETVYGLGAKATLPEALQKIFIAKARPQERPLLVHVGSSSQITDFVTEISPLAKKLMREFWPGPLAIVLPSGPHTPKALLSASAGIGFRCPSNKVARELIRLTGPIAAPSANLSGHPSPLTAEHVIGGLNGRIPAVLDAGPVELGLESTVLDLSVAPARLLRIGSITPEEITHCLGFMPEQSVMSSAEHYEIKSKLIVSENLSDFLEKFNGYQVKKIDFVLVITDHQYDIYKRTGDYTWYLPEQQNLFFDLLHKLEKKVPKIVLFTPFNRDKDISKGIKDRLQKSLYSP